MAVATPPSPPEGRMGPAPARTAHKPDRRPRPNFETWAWFFMRVSGIVLLFLALTHFAITHIVNDVVETDFEFVANRWESPLWRIFDWALLALALGHGLVGVRTIIDDYVRSPGRRALTKAVTYSVSGTLFAYGTLVIVTFPS